MNTLTFEPGRQAGLDALDGFVQRAGRHYAENRNYDNGPDDRANVSQLSPYLRHRLITEEEVLTAVLDAHPMDVAEKFVTEVFWRTYWKGWLEMRPDVWHSYRAELLRALDAVQTQRGLRQRWEDACHGETGIGCFDAWARELAETGYLHNHARMWFASIWIFTLGLPWQLGADFFLRHLLDGDPASNTLSWRWVAGLQTEGKHYLATPENIATYTKGRFRPDARKLNTDAAPLEPQAKPDLQAAPVTEDIDFRRPTALLLHKDDLSPDWLFNAGLTPVVTLVLPPSEAMTVLQMSENVQTFRATALMGTRERLSVHLGEVVTCTPDQVAGAAMAAGAEQIVTPYAPVGPVKDALERVDGLPLRRALRAYDARAWPHATAGFFKFRKQIPMLLGAMRGLEVV